MGTAGRRNDESEVELVMADWMWMDVYVRMRSIHTLIICVPQVQFAFIAMQCKAQRRYLHPFVLTIVNVEGLSAHLLRHVKCGPRSVPHCRRDGVALRRRHEDRSRAQAEALGLVVVCARSWSHHKFSTTHEAFRRRRSEHGAHVDGVP